MKTLTITGLNVYCSAVNVNSGEPYENRGWKYSEIIEGDNLTAVSDTDNWRTMVIVPPSKLSGIRGKIHSIKLVAIPKSDNPCSPACTQAILCDKSDYDTEQLLNNNWMIQESIGSTSSGWRFGDYKLDPEIGNELSSNGEYSVFENIYGINTPSYYNSDNKTESRIETNWSKNETAPKIQYLFNFDEKIGQSSHWHKWITYKNIDDIIGSNRGLAFYVTRYFPDNWSSSMGKTGWLRTTDASWSVEIVYESDITVTINTFVDDIPAGSNFKNYLKKYLVFTVRSPRGITTDYKYAEHITVPIGYKIRCWTKQMALFEIQPGSEISSTYKEVTEIMELRLSLYTELYVLNLNGYGTNAYEYGHISKLYDEQITLPILPSTDEVASGITPAHLYSGCYDMHTDTDGDSVSGDKIQNNLGVVLEIPSGYLDSDWKEKSDGKYGPSIARFYTTSTIPRNYTINVAVKIFGTEVESRTFENIKPEFSTPEEFNNLMSTTPSEISNYMESVVERYPGVQFSFTTMQHSLLGWSSSKLPTWKTIMLSSIGYTVSIVADSSVDAGIALKYQNTDVSEVYIMYKDSSGNLLPVVYKS